METSTEQNRAGNNTLVKIVVVIFSVEKQKLHVLLVKHQNNPNENYFAIPSSFLKSNETTRDAAGRILKEKMGTKNVYLEQLYTFDEPRSDSRGNALNVAYFALIPTALQNGLKKPKKQQAQTLTLFDMQKLPILATDHRKIIHYARQRLQYKLEYTNLVYALLPKFFTFSDLQKTYEHVLNRKLDKRNFRKKFISLNLVLATRKKLAGTKQRPAKLYRFKFKRLLELKRFF